MPAFTYIQENQGLRVPSHPEIDEVLQKVRKITQSDFRVLTACHPYKPFLRKLRVNYHYTLVHCMDRSGEAQILVDSGTKGLEIHNYLQGMLDGVTNVGVVLHPPKMYGFTRTGEDLPEAFIVTREVMQIAFGDAPESAPISYGLTRAYAQTIADKVGLSDYKEANDWLEALYQQLTVAAVKTEPATA